MGSLSFCSNTSTESLGNRPLLVLLALLLLLLLPLPVLLLLLIPLPLLLLPLLERLYGSIL